MSSEKQNARREKVAELQAKKAAVDDINNVKSILGPLETDIRRVSSDLVAFAEAWACVSAVLYVTSTITHPLFLVVFPTVSTEHNTENDATVSRSFCSAERHPCLES